MESIEALVARFTIEAVFLALMLLIIVLIGAKPTRKGVLRLLLTLSVVWFGLALIGIVGILILGQELSGFVDMALLVLYGPIAGLCSNKVIQWDEAEKDRFLAERLADPSYVPMPAESHARHSHFRTDPDALSDIADSSQANKE